MSSDYEEDRFVGERRPFCEDCGNPVDWDYYWDIDGELLCDSCAKRRYRYSTEDQLGPDPDMEEED